MDRQPSGPDAARPAWWPLGTPADVARALAFVVQEVLDTRLDARSANAATGGLNALLGALRDGDLERRMASVEAALEVGLQGAPAGG